MQLNRLFDCNLTNHTDGQACIIAEAGINHDGSLEKAKRLIDAAAEAKATCVKFQAFRTEHVSSKYTVSSSYMIEGSKKGESAYELSKRLEFNAEALAELQRYARQVGIPWIASFFDEYSLEFLVSLKVPVLKVASALINDYPLLAKAAATGIPLIVSTGMASIDEIDAVIDILRSNQAGEVYLMHCVSWYPAAVEDMNIRVIDTLEKRYGIPVGLSDHTMGLHVACAARARGAKLFEKHFTLSRKDFGPDHGASLEPEELKALVQYVGEVGDSLGCGDKNVTPIEIEQRRVFRRSLVARCPIPSGTVITVAHLATKRPGYGVAPKEMDKLVGMRAKQDIAADEPIRWEMVECKR